MCLTQIAGPVLAVALLALGACVSIHDQEVDRQARTAHEIALPVLPFAQGDDGTLYWHAALCQLANGKVSIGGQSTSEGELTEYLENQTKLFKAERRILDSIARGVSENETAKPTRRLVFRALARIDSKTNHKDVVWLFQTLRTSGIEAVVLCGDGPPYVESLSNPDAIHKAEGSQTAFDRPILCRLLPVELTRSADDLGGLTVVRVRRTQHGTELDLGDWRERQLSDLAYLLTLITRSKPQLRGTESVCEVQAAPDLPFEVVAYIVSTASAVGFRRFALSVSSG